jgi:glycosyltransferase involved in cell wall biosynthesis
MGRYAVELYQAVCREHPPFELIAYLMKGFENPTEGNPDVRFLSHIPKPSRLNWMLDWLMLPRQFEKDRLDLFHATDLTVLPKSMEIPVWMTVHDLIPYVFWEETISRVPKDHVYMLKQVWKQISRAERIITCSEFSKRDICEKVRVDANRVNVVYLGCSKKLERIPVEQSRIRLSAEYGLTEPFLFYVGGTDYRKNLPFLLKAFAKIRKRGYPGSLVLGGETFQLDIPEIRELNRLTKKLQIDQLVFKPGYIPDQDLACFYSACDFFVFPSLYEGFGLPVLEALSCGAPVLSSSVTSIPEVSGDCAFYFDPRNENDLVNVFWESFEDRKGIEERRNLGYEWVARFSWEKAAREIIALYSEAANSG